MTAPRSARRAAVGTGAAEADSAVRLRSALQWLSRPLAQWASVLYGAVVSLALTIVLARWMGAEAFGRYAYIVSLCSLLALAQDAGLRTLLMREGAGPTPGLAFPAETLPAQALVHLLVATAMLLMLVLAWRPGGDTLALCCGIACFAMITFSQWVTARLRADGHFVRDACWQALGRTSSAACMVLAAWVLGARPWVILLAWCVGLVLAMGAIPKGMRLRFTWRIDRRIYAAAAPFLWIDLATTLYHRIDLLILHGLLGTVAPVGHYVAAYRVYDGVIMLAAPLAVMLFRALRRAGEGPVQDRLVVRALLLAGLLGAGLAATGWLVGPVFAGLLFGAGYRAETGVLIGWLFSAFVFVLPNYVMTQLAIARHRQRWYAVSAGLCALLNIALNLCWVRDWGVRGSAWATVATEAVLAGLLVFGLRRGHRSQTGRAGDERG